MDLSNESDDRLLGRMGRKDDPGGCRAAWGEFFCRHREFLHGVCFKACRGGDRHEAAKDLVVATFQRAYKSAATFTPPEGISDEEMRLVVMAWLGRIASRIAIDLSRKEKSEKPVHLDQSEWQDIREKRGEVASEHTSEVCRVMNDELTEREQDVLRTTFNSYDPDRQNQKLSSEDIQALAEKWKMTPENVRQIRRRALAKLTTALQASMSAATSERTGP